MKLAGHNKISKSRTDAYFVNILLLVLAFRFAIVFITPPIEVHLQPVNLLLFLEQLWPVWSLFFLAQEEIYTSIFDIVFGVLRVLKR
jgi:hypothetical protein